MHRFIGLKKLHVGHVNISSGVNGVQYPRTCTLCNRITAYPPFTGKGGNFRVHSTSAKPNRIVPVSVRKMYRVLPSFANTYRTDVGSLPKSRRKMKITILDSKEVTGKEVDHRSFITSSPSSPAFNSPGISNVGVTIMLPPTASSKTVDSVLQLNTSQPPPAPSSECPRTIQPAELSNAAAELMFSGLLRGKNLIHDFSRLHNGNAKLGVPIPLNFDQISPKSYICESDIKGPVRRHGPVQDSAIKKDSMVDHSKKNLTETKSNGKKISKPINKNSIETKVLAQRILVAQKKKVLRRTAYIHVCVHAGKLRHALAYAKEGLQYFSNIPSRNLMLEPLFIHAVLEGNFVGVVHLISVARDLSCPLSVNTYIKCFELLSRLPRDDAVLSITTNIYETMLKDGISVDDLITHCKGRNILIRRVLKAIDMTAPETSASFTPQLGYSVDILSPLNDVNQAKAPRYYSPATGLLTDESAHKFVDEQIKAFTSNSFRVKNIACQLTESEREKLLEEQTAMVNEWRKTIKDGFERGLRAAMAERGSSQFSAFLECLPIESFVELIIQEVYKRLDDSERLSVGFTVAERALGRRVKEYYDMHVLEKYKITGKTRQAYIDYCKWYSNPESFPDGPSNPREIWETVLSKLDFDDSIISSVSCEWNSEMLLKIGKFMYNVLLKDVKVNVNIGTSEPPQMAPLLYVVFRKTTRGYQKQVKMHPAVYHIFPPKVQPYLSLNPEEVPMVCPPRPWVSPSIGVYPFTTPQLQRSPASRVGEDVMVANINAVSTHQLYPCFDSLNQLGSIPWSVNKKVLDVITEVFKTGGSKELNIPFPPTASVAEPPIPKNASLTERIKVSKERARIRQENAATYSLWCDTLYKLCIAHEFRDRIFWLPHNMDFRGRVYPICPHLQHMSNDVARSILIFAKGEKLGPDGLDWLKLHTINLVGNMNKDSLAARLAYANEIMPKILDSAEKPLTGERWWIHSEYPWQTLAACMEIAAALASGDPENFISHFPVHQDGSCNGLQHYAALGRDSLGAQSVNLVDTEKPSDVYMCVANSVEQKRANDAADGNAVAQSLEGFVTRKVIKQTVMTTVYGVTGYGAKLQITGQLKDLEYPMENLGKASSYLTQLVFNSLGEMFTSSMKIQDWLTECATVIVKYKDQPVQWITPLGLPVVQPYFKQINLKNLKKRQVIGNENAFNSLSLPITQKNRNAFPPNFIHSLDSCHMMLTGLYCEQANVPFVSVHDCYWVLPKNVAAMSKICREQFVALHSKNLLEDLSEFLLKTYYSEESNTIDENHKFSTIQLEAQQVAARWIYRLFNAVPSKGNFDLREVLKSKYFFS